MTETPYTKTTSDGKTQQKITRKCETVSHEIPYKDAYSKLLSMKSLYTSHKFEVYNDAFNWSKVLETTKDIGEIYHMDFSENLAQQYRYEPQSSHFSKRQFSLHCTFKHLPNSHEYIYHLSNEMKHNYAFTATVLRQLINESSSDIIRLKSDNCAIQYKYKSVFKVFHSLAVKMQKKIVSFYGASSHKKGLVDAMSSYRVKPPIRRGVLTKDFSYGNAKDIFDYLTLLFGNDINKHILIDGDEIQM